MCGIGLWYSKEKMFIEEAFKKYMLRIVHRGPDFQAQIKLNDHLFIGNNRLGIIDNNPRSNQPFNYLHYTISFNGAIYNFKALRQELIALGHQFHTESDTELIIHSFAEFGPSCVDNFDGMWAFVIYDKQREELFCSRDRFGIKPFYYLYTDTGFYVGSELKQFVEIPEYQRDINSSMVKYYLDSGGFKNYSEQTFYTGILQLEPGHHLIFNIKSHKLEVIKYYALEETEEPDNQYVIELIEEAVRNRTIADINPAVMFSGGLDSSILLGHLLQIQNNTRSYSFIEDRIDTMNETSYIESFLEKYNHQNHQISLPDNFDKLLADCLYMQDEPPASLSALAQYLIYSLASKNNERLMISGQGADELFAGYPRNLSLIKPIQFIKYPRATISFIGDNFDLILKRISPSISQSSLFNTNLNNASNYNSIQSYMKYLIENNGLRDLLHYEDRNSMAHGIETRLPFLSHHLVEFAYHLDEQLKMKGLKRKGLLLDAYREVIPAKILARKNKIAFDTPEAFLLKANYFSATDNLKKIKEKFPQLDWNEKFNLKEHGNPIMIWQMKFLNSLFID